MRIINKTNWKTADLRAIISRIAKTELTAAQRKTLVVEINGCRNQRATDPADAYWNDSWSFTSGWAWWAGSRAGTIAIHMPTRWNLNGRERVGLCSTIAHEMAHIRTRKGGPAVERAMRTSVPYGSINRMTEKGAAAQLALYAWVHEMPIRRADAKPAAAPPAPQPAAAAATTATASPTLIERRAAKAAATLARWESELARRERAVKRARRKVAESRRRVAYYQKRREAGAGAGG